jgi:HEAT repeat protein
LAVCAALGGCAGVWDDVTSRDFHARSIFRRPDPLTVLRESTDGDARAKAMAALQEPRRHGGTDAEQEEVVRFLTAAATADPQPLCRMNAIQTLGRFQDPRAVPALVSAYETATQLPAEVAVPIQTRALTSLGETRQPAAVNFLVQVAARGTPAETGDRERDQTRNSRLAAVRALRSFEHSPEVADAMVRLMQSEKDVALRDRARETYVKVTGSEPPPESMAPPMPAPQSDGGMQLTGGTTGR